MLKIAKKHNAINALSCAFVLITFVDCIIGAASVGQLKNLKNVNFKISKKF